MNLYTFYNSVIIICILDFCYNYDLENIITTVNAELLVSKLKAAKYPEEKISFLQDGFVNGFDIGYRGPKNRQSTAENIPFTIGDETELWGKLMKEVKLKRVAGPFSKIPFENYIQSPIGLVPKAGGDQTRLIFHLSYDFKKDGLKSLNHFTPKELCSVTYRDIDHAVSTYLDLWNELMSEIRTESSPYGSEVSNDVGVSRRQLKRKWKLKFDKYQHRDITRLKPVIYAGKSDLKSAFRILGLSRDSWPWLIMKARNPVTGQWEYFVDKCLPFGSSISCALFQCFSDALCHLIQYRLQIWNRITNYLDDFLFIARCIALCNYMINQFLQLCEELGVPISAEKTEWATDCIIFLGILLDGRNLLSVPLEKREAAMQLLKQFLMRRKTTVKSLQQLCGHLNFLSKAIYPGRAFTRRMYAKFSNILNIGGAPKNNVEYKLKQHHHVRLDSEFKLDCNTWLQFLQQDLAKVVNRKMIDVTAAGRSSVEVGFFSDSSAAKDLGFGAILGDKKWIQGMWGADFITQKEPSIAYLELFALTAGILTWGDEECMRDTRICVHCDNISVVHMVNNLTSSCKNCMILIHLLVLNGLQYNRRLTAKYISTHQNGIADSLSRNQLNRFRELAPNMNEFPDRIPHSIWPIQQVWRD